MAKLTFLGTGTSQGVPMIGCGCDVCRSRDPRDKRLRSSVLVEHEGLTILVDAGPDFRQQMLRAGVSHLDAILLTHNHKDHTGGLDDIRAFNYIDKKASEIYCEKYVEDALRMEYSYAFAEKKYPGAPEWHVHIIDEKPITISAGGPYEVRAGEPGQGFIHSTAGTDDITGTDLGCDCGGQCLERGQTALLLAAAELDVAKYLLHAFAEAANLHEASLDGEDEAGAHQQENENVVREIGVDRCDDLENCSFHDVLFLQKNKSC